jgi:iron-sulfur cluster assembly accessory protein
MTVGSFDPHAFESHDIIVTDAARAHMEAQATQSGRPALRLGVKESGCNGYMYTLDFIDGPEEDDLQVATGGSLRLYVRRRDLPLVGGTQVDFVREGLNASLKFKNPNAESHCGCGESFAIQTATS